MRALIQKVSEASVKVENKTVGKINRGFLVFLGIEHEDNSEDVDWLARKITAMRLFEDDRGKINLSLKDVDGQILLVSQFTLHASTRKGNRPSFIRAAKPDIAIPLYNEMRQALDKNLGKETVTGEFGAYMEIELTNDGPVTIWMDSKKKE